MSLFVLGKPDFSEWTEIVNYDFYGLIGGTQNIEIDFEIEPTSNGEYILKTMNSYYL